MDQDVYKPISPSINAHFTSQVSVENLIHSHIQHLQIWGLPYPKGAVGHSPAPQIDWPTTRDRFFATRVWVGHLYNPRDLQPKATLFGEKKHTPSRSFKKSTGQPWIGTFVDLFFDSQSGIYTNYVKIKNYTTYISIIANRNICMYYIYT